MAVKQVFHNVVILAKGLAPGMISERWLRKCDVVREEEFRDNGTLFTPVAIRVETEFFELLALPDRIQATVFEGKQATAVERLQNLIRVVPAELSAVGINFHYHVTREPPGAQQFTADLFLAKGNPFSDLIGPKAMVGSYIAVPAADGLLRLEIKPGAALDEQNIPPDTLLVQFNYHYKPEGENVDRSTFFCGALAHAATAEAHANTLVHLLSDQ